VQSDKAYLFSQRSLGAGGLPAGVEGRAVALISGGFDSAVASWQMLRRGVELDYILCNLGGPAFERSVLGIVKVLADLWSYGLRPQLHVVDFEPLVIALRRDVNRKYVQVLLKRLMYRVADRIAAQIDAQAIVTGEAIGQVSSQTLINLRAIDEVASLPVLRPLVGSDKEPIIDQSKSVGTYALSALVKEYCALVPDKPVTAARPEAVRDEESHLDLSALDDLIAARKVVDVRSLKAGELAGPYLSTSEVPKDAVVVDCRPRHQYQAWHYPGAIHRELEDLLEHYKSFDRDRTYVLYCPFGLQSAVVAERMQRAGYEAYSFKGGTRALRAYGIEQGVEEDW
jgi:thiamine biosynthesis protein ThiI